MIPIHPFLTSRAGNPCMAITSPTMAVCALLAVLLLAVAVTGCTSSQGPTPQGTGTASPAAGPAAVTIKSFAFSPQEMTVKQGTAVTWTNEDNVPHTIVTDAGATEAFSSDALGQGGAFTFTFTKPGTYPYHCSIHPSMKGTVTVTS
jgi:plastocyanin